MKSILAFLFGAFITLYARNPMLYPDVKILSSDDNGMTLEFRPSYFSNQTIVSDDGTFEIPQFKFGFQALINEAGREDLRARVISLAVPGHSGNSITVLAADFEMEGGFALAPIPLIVPKDNLGAVERRYKTKFFSEQEFFPAAIVSVHNIGKVKGWNTANLVITPLQYQSSTKTLRKYSRIVVRIDYGAREAGFDNSGNDEWARAALINYQTGKRWASTTQLKKSAAVNALLSTGTWCKLEVVEDGMYKIDATYLRSIGIEPSSLSSITDVKIFGGDGRNLPENLLTPRPSDLPQVTVQYVFGSNSQSSDDDYLLFYGQGTRGWHYDPAQKSFGHFINIYSDRNYYFLSVGANAPVKEMLQRSHGVGNGSKVTSTLGKAFFKEEKFNFNLSGQNWVSAPLNQNESRVISTKLDGRIPGTSVRYIYNLFSRANVDATFVIEESGTQIGSLSLFGMSDDTLDDPESDYAREGASQATANINLTDSRSNLKFTYQANGTVANGFIDWVRIFYQQQLTAQNNQLLFHSPDTSGFVDYRIEGFTSNDVALFDISDVGSVKKLQHQTEQQMGAVSFRDSNAVGSLKRYWVGTTAAFKYPKSFVKLPNSNLHGYNGAEFVIITPGEFKAEAVRLKNHKESLPAPISTVVVDIDTLFNEFGLGLSDPTAMRDFLKYASDNWNVKPKYVLFFGDASVDHKLILGSDKWWVPTIQTSQSNNKISSYNYEDYFAYLDPNNPTSVSIAHGRLCPRSVEQARVSVDRIILYETTLFKSPWKNTITIVADDLWSTDNPNEEFNTSDSELLARSYTPADYEIKRIYTEEYPLIQASSGRRRPEARQAIIDQVNNGTLILNYAGHGNPKVWAHEAILTYDDTKTQFVNNDRLTFIVAATCDWGRFDEPGEQSSAEEVMVAKNGGAIGVLSATRAVYAHANAATNQWFYSYMLNVNPVMRLGDANMLTKNILFDVQNKQKYFLLCDPTLRLAAPRGTISIDSINGIAISSTDTLKALSRVTVRAYVRDSSGAKETGYNGTALVTVFDAERTRTMIVTIRENGAIIYKGEASVKNGEVNTTFIVPKDIAYENKKGRMSLYFSNSTGDGRGYTTNFIVGGTNQQFVPDSLGPKISIYFDNTSFRSGDVVNSSPTLIVELNDSSGINSSANSIGHRLEAWIDGSSKAIDLTESYKGKIDSYQSGGAEYRLSNLSPGEHTIKVRAWDVHNNSATAEAQFFVSAEEGLSIHNVYNFPNPVKRATTFTFQHNQLANIDVSIKIYTVAGRLIHSVERFGYSDRFFKMDWDTRDHDGDLVGNGIYIYRVSAKTTDGKYSSEATGTLSVVR
ncbi:MAG: type IX secretion system sortase PorU [Ignavibacteriales bacterium]|nr:type IX secretion system sortase PorU [Ignavibacteriales bacterium]